MRTILFTAAAVMTATPAAASPREAAAADKGTYSFAIARSRGQIFNPWTGAQDPVELRSFLGSGTDDGDFVAPTLRVAPGGTLTVDLNNRLEPCSAEQRKAQRCFNDTNLHTHGLWVSPSGNSDNVLISIAPGERFRYRYEIPADHPAGTFWYHPHRHGSGFVQVGSGMAGALIVTGNRKPTADRPGDIDILLRDSRGAPLRERILLFQQIQYACFDEKKQIEGRLEKDEYVRPWTCAPGRVGGIESDDHDWDWRWSGRFTGINGKVQPKLEAARAGAFERWRLVHAGTREKVRMRLHRLDPAAPDLASVRAPDQEAWIARHCVGEPLPIWHIAADGLTRSAVRRTQEAVLFPGDRMDVLARFPAAGRYCLIQQVDPEKAKSNASRVLAVVEARGAGDAAADADARLQSLLLKAASRSLAGAVRDRVAAELKDGMKLSSFVWHKPIPKEEVGGYREAILNILEPPDTNGAVMFHINGRPYDHGRIDHVLPLGGTEEWHVRSLTANHPLHLHVNPFQIVWIRDAQGRDVTDPATPAYDPDFAGLVGEWKDTVLLKEGYRIALRTRYERFTGDFVTHCHIMFHGDHGMMMNLRIADPRTAPPATATHP
jgi:FtsP/CotA-like multicopper oxidase with cupredoxin domain